MLTITIDEANHFAILEPLGSLSKADFEYAVTIIDPYIEKTRHMGGCLFAQSHFPDGALFRP